MKYNPSSFARLSYLIVVLLTLALVTAACGDATTPSNSVTTTAANTNSSNEIKLGVLAVNSGAFIGSGKDAERGVEMAVAEFGGKIGNKKITLVKDGSDATPASARDAARRLIEQQNVDAMIGPLSGDEGLAIRNYARTRPDKVFVNGSAGAQDITLRDPAPNLFRFNTDGVQWMAGLGTYVYETQKYRKVVIIAEDYSFPYSQVGGFMTEFCKAGGSVPKKFWIPVGTTDYSTVVSAIPSGIDALYVALGGTDAINFLKQYDQTGAKTPIIAGTVTLDQTVLSTGGSLSQRLLGTAAAGPIADNNPDPKWQKFVQDYRTKFPDGLDSPSLFAHAYYINAKALLLGLQKVDGDFSNNSGKLKEALATLEFETPTGMVKLDKNRQAIGDIFLTVIDQKPDGKLYNKLVKTSVAVNQTLGIPEVDYLKAGSLGRDNPNCP